MGNEAHGAGLLGERARSARTGLDRRTPAGIARPLRSGTARGELMRLFVAIAPSAAVLDELDALAGPLRAGRQDLRWTNREAWHVTLAFLGQVDESAANRLLRRLEKAARRHHVFRLGVSGPGALPPPPPQPGPRVLGGARPGARGARAPLAEWVAAGASRAGAPPPDKGRRFRPHV